MEGDADFFKNNLYLMFSSSVQVKSGQLSNSLLSVETLFQGDCGFCVRKTVA